MYADKRNRLFVDVRSNHVQHSPALMLVPLLPVRIAPKPIRELNPVLTLREEEYVLMTQLIASVPHKGFGRVVGTLNPCWDDNIHALDIMFTGL